MVKREVLKTCMLCALKEESSILNLEQLYANIATAKVSWLTDKTDNYNSEDYKEFQVMTDGNYHTYKIHIPAQGSRLRKIKIDGFGYPADISIESATIKSLNLEEIVNKNLIHSFAK